MPSIKRQAAVEKRRSRNLVSCLERPIGRATGAEREQRRTAGRMLRMSTNGKNWPQLGNLPGRRSVQTSLGNRVEPANQGRLSPETKGLTLKGDSNEQG